VKSSEKIKRSPSRGGKAGNLLTTQNNGATNLAKRSDSNPQVNKKLIRHYMPPFVRFAESSELVKSLQKYGKRVAPLQLIGTFLSFVGNIMLHDIFTRFGKKIFFGNCQAKRITQHEHGIWVTEAVFIKSKMPMKIIFRSKNVIMASGSNQFVPKNFIKDFCIRPSSQVMTSDYVLKDKGFMKLVQLIRNRQGKCRISIMGGSHSAFSVLQLLLNGQVKIGLFEEFNRRQQVGRVKGSKLRLTNGKVPQGIDIPIC
jgi:hypothetical protein